MHNSDISIESVVIHELLADVIFHFAFRSHTFYNHTVNEKLSIQIEINLL